MNENKKLKPVVFVKGRYHYNRDNKLQQNLLLKAFQVTSDPRKLKEMVGLRSVAEVYRTLDKIAIRKEYHEALAKHNLDLFTIVGDIKGICKSAKSDAVRLDGYKTLLKSLGLDNYKDVPDETQKTWEDILKQTIEMEKTGEIEAPQVEYEVIVPEVPEEEKEKREEERKLGESIYE